MSRRHRGAALLAAAVLLVGCSSDDADTDGDDTDTGSTEESVSGAFDEIVGDAAGECLSLALTASQIPVVSSGPDADEAALDESIAQLDMALPEELLDELATMAAIARDALALDETSAEELFASEEYENAASAVLDHLHDDCE